MSPRNAQAGNEPGSASCRPGEGSLVILELSVARCLDAHVWLEKRVAHQEPPRPPAGTGRRAGR